MRTTPGTTRAAIVLAVAIGVTPLPGVPARAAVNVAAPAFSGGDDGHGDDGGSRRGRERESRHGRDDGTPRSRERVSPRPRHTSPRPSPTHADSPAVAPARPVSRRSPSRHDGTARLAAIAGLGGLLILAALLTVGGRRLARLRSV